MTSLSTFTARTLCSECDTPLVDTDAMSLCADCGSAREYRRTVEQNVRAFRLYYESGFPLHALSALSSADVSAGVDDVRAKVSTLLAGASERSTLYITGSVGTGKTVEASRAGLAVLLAGGGAHFVTSSDYLARIKSAYGDTSRDSAEEIVARALAAPLLVLDDLGVERATAHAVARLLELVDARYRAMKPMIITSNYSLSELATHLAGGASHEERADARENTRRLCDRLQEIATGAHLQGVSHRKTARPDTWAKLRRIVAAMEADARTPSYSIASPDLLRFMQREQRVTVEETTPAARSRTWRDDLVEVLPDLSDLAARVDLEIFASRNTRAVR